ncbi:unnamed protein product [Penicillium olsonii]|uniref:Uncharacterized protein n=1 Tax=Penicillium olsonii TaxID=99116 RepID=A0A9W4HFH2_PENOL|nr:unnamed protein product [Penicillium olsonii]CAG8149712.1 unnamed protein product [Penicillium olsonii]
MHLNTCPSCLLFIAFILTFIHSAISQPIRASKWIKSGPFETINPHGTWTQMEKEAQSYLASPSQVNHNQMQSPAWRPTGYDMEATEQMGLKLSHSKGISASTNQAIPIVSATPPGYLEMTADKTHKHYSEYVKAKSGLKSKLEEISNDAIAADRQHRYDEFLRNMHIKNAIHQKHSDNLPGVFSVSSGQIVSFFTYRIPIPTLRFNTSSLTGYPFPGVFTTVIVLLAMVWIAMITIGLVELGNHMWMRRRRTVDAQCSKEHNVELDKLAKVPITVVAIPTDRVLITKNYQLTEHALEDSDENSDSDEDDYRIF